MSTTEGAGGYLIGTDLGTAVADTVKHLQATVDERALPTVLRALADGLEEAAAGIRTGAVAMERRRRIGSALPDFGLAFTAELARRREAASVEGRDHHQGEHDHGKDR